MLNRFATPIRAVLVALALAFAAHAADARGSDEASRAVATARTTARTENGTPAAEQDSFPLGGLLIVAGIVGGLIVLAWIASRIGDSRTDTVG